MKMPLIAALMFGAGLFAAQAANTSAEQPESLVDLTTADATKAFSLVKPNSNAWLQNSDTQQYLDFTKAFDNGGRFDNTDRAIINVTKADFGYDFGTPTVVNAYKIYLPVNGGYSVPERAPKSWIFQGSDDRETWTDLDTRTEETGWGSTGSRFYAFENAVAFRYYRLNVLDVCDSKGGGGYLQIAELEFFDWEEQTLDFTQFEHSQDFKIAGMDEGVAVYSLPVLVRLDPSQMAFGRADHADLAFSQTLAGKEITLPYEVDTWTENSALVWVCLNTAARAGAFRMYWGAETDVASTCPYTWPGYAQVVHFNGTAADSAKYSCVGSSRGDEDGLIGGGVSGPKTKVWHPFAGLSDQTNFTVSAWVKPTANSGNVRILSTKEKYENDGMELIYVKDAGIYLRGDKAAKQAVYSAANDEAFTRNVWTHYLAVCKGTTGIIYRNGLVTNGRDTIDAATTGTKDLMLGGYNGDAGDGNLSGAMDELRIYNGTLSDERIKAEYQAMADVNFLIMGAIPSTVEVTAVESAQDESRLTITGNVQLGEEADSVTVVIAVGSDASTADATYELPGCGSGAFSYAITDLAAGRYYLSVGLQGVDGSFSEPAIYRVGVLPAIEWTGNGDGSSWTDANNWSSLTVPDEFDSVLFGGHVPGAKTISAPNPGEAMAKRISITTPYALRLENVAALDVTIADTAAEENIIAPLAINLMDGQNVATWTVPEGKRLKLGDLMGRASVLKLGAGEVLLAGTASDRAVGTTDVREGTLIFGAKKQLGAGLSVGGSEIPAVVRVNNPAKFNPFDGEKRPIHVLTNGTFDCASDGGADRWIEQNKSGPFTVDAGGTLDLGKREFGFAGMERSFVINGQVVSANAKLALEYSAIVVGETAEAPVAFDCPLSVMYQYAGNRSRYATFEVAAGKSLTLNGVISGAWEPRDGIDKQGAGVLHLTAANRYGGGSNESMGRTSVYAGTLLVDNATGSGTGHSRVYVSPGATIGGIGTIGGDTESYKTQNSVCSNGFECLNVAGNATAAATVWPGTVDDATGAHVNGALKVGSAAAAHPVTFGDYSTLKITFGRTPVADALVVYGTVDVAATGTKLELAPNCELEQVRGGTFTVLSATEGITGDFAEIVKPKSGWVVAKVNPRQVAVGEGDEATEVEVYDALTVTMPGCGHYVILR